MLSTLLEFVFGLKASDWDVGRREQVSHQCTNCGTKFDTGSSTCPQCGSQIYRTKTDYPYARLTFVVVMGLAGLQMVRNVLTGNYPKEGPAQGPPTAEKEKQESSGDRPVQP